MSPQVFDGLGLDGNTTSLLATGVLGVVNSVFTVPAIIYMDRFGRKKLLMAGAIGMCLSHIVVASIVGKYEGQLADNKSAGWAGVAFIYVRRLLQGVINTWSLNVCTDLHCQLCLFLGPNWVGPALRDFPGIHQVQGDVHFHISSKLVGCLYFKRSKCSHTSVQELDDEFRHWACDPYDASRYQIRYIHLLCLLLRPNVLLGLLFRSRDQKQNS